MDGLGRNRKRLVVYGGLAIVLGLALFGAVKYTSRSEFCITCHEMKPLYSTWKNSSHSSVECIKCHSDPGVVGLVKTKTQALKEVYLHITGTYEQPITINWDTAAFTARCLGCHQDIKGRGTAHNLSHFNVNITCADCHKGLVHNSETNNRLPSRKVCIRCHGREITD